MKTLVKNVWLLFTLCLVGLVAASCDSDKDDEVNTEVKGSWLMTGKQDITKDANGNEVAEDMRMMQEEVWEFNSDGTQDIINDGVMAEDRYNYTIKGSKITLSPVDATKGLPTMTGTVEVRDQTMIIRINMDDSGDEVYKYTFSRQQ